MFRRSKAQTAVHRIPSTCEGGRISPHNHCISLVPGRCSVVWMCHHYADAKQERGEAGLAHWIPAAYGSDSPPDRPFHYFQLYVKYVASKINFRCNDCLPNSLYTNKHKTGMLAVL